MASNTGLYDPSFEHDACGIGFVANIKGNKGHQIISDALTVLENMEHRGACGCENNSGDGAGIMIQTPHEFFFEECLKLNVHLPSFGKYAVGVLFFPSNERLKHVCRETFNRAAEKLGFEILCYRKVPVDKSEIGPTALSVEPDIEQVFIAMPERCTDLQQFERKLFVLRNYSTHLIEETVKEDAIGFYIASFHIKLLFIKDN
jgi:glutamate synthase (NADPH/NADH) large chain